MGGAVKAISEVLHHVVELPTEKWSVRASVCVWLGGSEGCRGRETMIRVGKQRVSSGGSGDGVGTADDIGAGL